MAAGGSDARMATWLERIDRVTLPAPRGLRVKGSFLLSVALVLAVAAAIYPLRAHIDGPTISLVYVMLIFAVGLAFGTAVAVSCAVVAFLVSDFLFYPPYFTLFLDKRPHLVGLLTFLVIAVGTGVLGSRLNRYASEARRDAMRTAMLYDLNRALISDITIEQMLTTIVRGVVTIYGAFGCRLLLEREREDAFDVVAVWPPHLGIALDRQRQQMAREALRTGRVTGISTEGRRVRLPHAVEGATREFVRRQGDDLLYIPVQTAEHHLGVLEVSGRPGGGRFRAEDERILTSFADQVALASERARLLEESTRARVLEQSGELKSALLSAVSHDLRTPLAAIKMSASALQDPQIEWDDEGRGELLAAIEQSTDWLALVVDNLLDLSRIEGGALRSDRDWHDLADLVHHVIGQMQRQLAHHHVVTRLPDDLPLVCIDYVQIAQVLTNILSNAVKYSPPGSEVEISVETIESERAVELRVTDHGRGIPKKHLPHVFETFYRVSSDSDVQGTGVGLAICKGLVEANGGSIRVESERGSGTVMRVRLPLDAPTEDEQGDAP